MATRFAARQKRSLVSDDNNRLHDYRLNLTFTTGCLPKLSVVHVSMDTRTFSVTKQFYCAVAARSIFDDVLITPLQITQRTDANCSPAYGNVSFSLSFY
jgi:hypothetical protein